MYKLGPIIIHVTVLGTSTRSVYVRSYWRVQNEKIIHYFTYISGGASAPGGLSIRMALFYMEQLNKIEIRGIVGSVYVKDFTNAKVANISVATNYTYNAKDGSVIVETTWHSFVALEGKDIQNLSQLKKGTCVYIVGRLRNRKYTTPDGMERIAYEIIANKVEIVEREAYERR